MSKLAGWNTSRGDDTIVAVLLATVLLGFFYAAMIVSFVPEWILGTSMPERVMGGLFLAALLGVPLALVLSVAALVRHPVRPTLLHVHCAGLPPHPAITELTADQEQRLLAGGRRRPPERARAGAWAVGHRAA